MKPISLVLITLTFCASFVARAQDAATEERLNKLSGQIEDLIAAQKDWKERIILLSKEVASLREQVSKPTGNFAAQDDLKHLADSLKEVDRKRLEDNERVKAELVRLSKTVLAPVPGTKKTASPALVDTTPSEKTIQTAKGFDYTIEKNDTLSLIVQAYREKNIKVTTEQILKANPGLKANQLRVGQKIFIPAPSSG